MAAPHEIKLVKRIVLLLRIVRASCKLMHTIVSNVLTHPDELSKYGRINLAATKLTSFEM